ncbi:DUF2851 family protein [Flavobacteriaceae bacterium GF1]
MREDLLHYVWKTQKFQSLDLRTSSQEPVEIIHIGQYNTSSGPDFFNARIRIQNQEWAGNVEIHVKSSDWYAHGHEQDQNYDNVILHVVWEDNLSVFRKDGSKIPTLALKEYLDEELLSSYKNLVCNKGRKFINCEKDANSVKSIIWGQWQQRLYIERLEQKSKQIKKLLKGTRNDWEGVLFAMIMKNFGLNKNGEAFLDMAKHLDYAVIKKASKDLLQLESLFFGVAGFLSKAEVLDDYFFRLQNEFTFLRNKFRIKEYKGERPIFFGLRPSNFPTIRLSQLARLYNQHPSLFSKIMECTSLDDFYRLFDVHASAYWDTHYTFGKESKKRKKGISRDFVHLVLINTIIPIKFCYDNYLGRNNTEELLELANTVPAEKNSIINRFEHIGVPTRSAFESQAKIQLYNGYCTANKCLQCHVGTSLLARKN